jgi:hypothetical protein
VSADEAVPPSGVVTFLFTDVEGSTVFLDRLGRLEPAAIVAGFAFGPFSASAFTQLSTAIAHLRDVLGHQTYEQLARKGETMTTAEMVTYAYDQIDQARTELSVVQK